MGKVTAEFGDNAKSITALTAKQDVLNRQLLNQTDKVEVLNKALKESADKYGESDKRTKDWQISLNRAEAELSKTKNELDSTSKQLDEFGDESKQSGDQVEKAGKQADKSGDNAKKGGAGWEKLGQGLSKIGGMAATAVKALAAASIAGATAIGALTIKAGEAADEINTLSKVTGLSTEDIQKFKYAADRIDVSLETLTKSMAKNIKSMKGVQDGTKLSVDAYKKLGVEVLNTDGSLRDGQTVYSEVIDALANMQNETERDALAMQILGKSAQELNPLILGGADALKQMGEEAEKAGLILSQSQLDKLNAVGDAVDTLKATMQGVGMQFATEFAGPISNGIDTVTGFVTELLSAYKAGGMDALADKTGEVLGDVINKFAESLPGILDATMDVINGILGSVIDNVPQMTETGVKFFVSLISDSLEIITKIVDALPEVVRGIADALTAEDGELLKKMIDAGVDLFVALVSSTAEIITVICDRLPEIVDGIAAGLTSEENLAKMGEAGITLMKAVARVFTKNPIADLITADVPDWYINGQSPPVTSDSPGAKKIARNKRRNHRRHDRPSPCRLSRFWRTRYRRFAIHDR